LAVPVLRRLDGVQFPFQVAEALAQGLADFLFLPFPLFRKGQEFFFRRPSVVPRLFAHARLLVQQVDYALGLLPCGV